MDAKKIMPQIITTGDGSHSLYNSELDETYHSRHGALQESRYVFIQQGLDLIDPLQQPIRILEVGFGTGLNAVLANEYGEKYNRKIEFTTLETFPLDSAVTEAINVEDTVGAGNSAFFSQLHLAECNSAIKINDTFIIEKLNTTVQDWPVRADYFDVIFYDAFGPRAQPEMWTLEIFQKLYNSMRKGGIFVTYCAKGQVRRDLTTVGFHTSRLPGPPGKREMLRGERH
jgi:tRNA U34 5-methylaminomethyl-2-thiouridine-forming methyltransferase MnmC